MAKVTMHQESRHYALRCSCGYTAKDDTDLEEHIEQMQRHSD